MSEVRRDPLTNAWIIVAPVRSMRPEELVEMQLPLNYMSPCPFCAGNEDSTPYPTMILASDGFHYEPRNCNHHHDQNHANATLHSRNPDRHASDPYGTNHGNGNGNGNGHSHERWAVRVVPNKYPAVEPLAEMPPPVPYQHPLFSAEPLSGAHEVIIESPVHVQSLTELQPQHAVAVFRCYAERLKHWFSQPFVRYAVVFKNVGAAAGASLRHLHSQLLATSDLPPQVASQYERMAAYHAQEQKCMLCEMLAEELRQARRIIIQTEHFVAYCPYASYLPYLIRITSRHHQTSFQDQSVEMLAEVAMLVRRLIGLLESAYSQVAYNFVVQTRDQHTHQAAAYHWWIDLFPRITKVAGFEWGSGGMINPVAPEKAAAHLRSLERLRAANARVEDFST